MRKSAADYRYPWTEVNPSGGLVCARATPVHWPGFHQHSDIELVLIETGALCFLIGGELLPLTAGQLCTFWATVPHQIVASENDTFYFYVHLPLVEFVDLRLPNQFVEQIFQGSILYEPDPKAASRDLLVFGQWQRDLGGNDPRLRPVVLAEIETRLRRLAVLHARWDPHGEGCKGPQAMIAASQSSEKVVRMVRYLAEGYLDEVSLSDIAHAVGLNPSYASHLFKTVSGLAFIDYLTRLRVAHAQMLLATTSANVVDIAFASGFGSVSRFYSVFRDATGMAPGQYRRIVSRQLPTGRCPSQNQRRSP